jgi:N-methylhydantoinase A
VSRYRIGVDVGGTFTDFVLYDAESGETRTAKVPSTPEDQSVGILEGLRKLGVPLGEVAGIAHGTTVATNALIERDGAKTAFLTTEGFRDTLEIRRTNRQELYDAHWVPPSPLVPRRNRLEVRERLRWDGEVDTPLDEAQVEDIIETLEAREIEAVAICFLHAYGDDRHERRVKELVQAALPEAFVTCSSELSLEFREFERGSTVAANAFVGPKVRRYMRNLAGRLRDEGFASEVAIMQSGGGVCSVEEAEEAPVKLARSGPAGGAMAIEQLAELTGTKNLVGVDIGGTSADVALVVDGRVRWTSPLFVEWGMPLLFPSVDVVSIGAGGGSIAWIDAAGVLHMGPMSAGAVPGPACYGRGGTEPTSTDAHVALGRVSGGQLLSGELEIRPELAEKAIEEHVAGPLGLGVHEAAEGMLKILDTAMLQAVRFLTIEKGYDPRDFALVGLGGGGPMHCATLARELGMAKAVVPVMPGVLSAWGMLTVDMAQDRSRTVLKRRHALTPAELGETLGGLRDAVHAAFARQGVPPGNVSLKYVLDMQYYGQVFTLPITLGDLDREASPDGAVRVTAEDLDAATQAFHAEHRREYGHADPGQEVQVVHARVFGKATVDHPEIQRPEPAAGDVSEAEEGQRPVFFGGERLETTVYDRGRLAPGHEFAGPAIVVEPSSTTVVPPSCRVAVDPYRNLVIDVGGE